MVKYPWNQQTMLVCVDSYENGVPQGQIFLPGQPGERFESLSQLLLRGSSCMSGAAGFSLTQLPEFLPWRIPCRRLPVPRES